MRAATATRVGMIVGLGMGCAPKNRPYEGEVAYGYGFEQPDAITRLRYHEMLVPRIVERIGKTATAGSDLTSWRY
jgi:hypothetical protein